MAKKERTDQTTNAGGKRKMASLISQAYSWKKKKERMVKKKGKREKTTTLSEKKEEASNVSEQRDKGWIHIIRVHDTTHC